MTDKTEEQIAAERAAITAMKGAQANMGKALDRIASLESALTRAIGHMREHKGYSGPQAHTYSAPPKSVHTTIDEHIAAATKALG